MALFGLPGGLRGGPGGVPGGPGGVPGTGGPGGSFSRFSRIFEGPPDFRGALGSFLDPESRNLSGGLRNFSGYRVKKLPHQRKKSFQ